jgi:hypothetical protein
MPLPQNEYNDRRAAAIAEARGRMISLAVPLSELINSRRARLSGVGGASENPNYSRGSDNRSWIANPGLHCCGIEKTLDVLP